MVGLDADGGSAVGSAPAVSGDAREGRLGWRPGGITAVAEPKLAPRPLSAVAIRPEPEPEPEPTLLPPLVHVGRPVRHIVFVPVPVMAVALVPSAGDPGAHAVDSDPRECEEARRADPSRLPWGLGWLYRYGRDVDLERSASTPFSFYLRSPLLSGLQDARGCPRPGAQDGDEDCAIVTVRTGVDQEITLEVPLPQLEARNARRLRAALRDRLERGEAVRLLTTEGEDIEIQPGAAREIDARACRA